MAMLPNISKTTPATFKVMDDGGQSTKQFKLQFNPASVEYSLSAEFDDRNGDNKARQFVKKTNAKLTMTLVFDSTDTGINVRTQTNNLALLLRPAKDGSKQFVPKVEFGWGAFSFTGVVEQFKETLDFFSADGVPLRASVNMTLAGQEVEFQKGKRAKVDQGTTPDPVAAAPGSGPSDVAGALGDQRAARAIAEANGSASLRFGAEASLNVGGSVSLAAAADFSVGAGAGLSLGAGVGVGMGVGGGVSGGIGGGITGGVGISGGLSGGIGVGASAGLGIGGSGGLTLTSTAGAAFDGLRVGSTSSSSVSVFDARAALLPAPGISGAASFTSGGRAEVHGGGSLSADVGATADLHGRIDFGV
jgi:hypothetical protein